MRSIRLLMLALVVGLVAAVGAAEGVPPQQLPVGVLRPLEEPLGNLVHDGDLRQPREDERLLAAH